METMVLALRVALSLAVVLGLLWVLQRRFSRGARTGARKLVRVVERQTIGPKASVVVVDADGRRFLLGVTDQAVNVLDTREAPVEEEAQPSEAQPSHRAPQTASDSFARLLELATGRTAAQAPAAARAAMRTTGSDRATAEYDDGAPPGRAASAAAGAGSATSAGSYAAAAGRADAFDDASDPFVAAIVGHPANPSNSADLPRRAARRAAVRPQPVEADTWPEDQPFVDEELDGSPIEEPGQDTDVIPLRHTGLYPIEGGRRSERTGRRASRSAGRQDRAPESPLAGSILSPSTWKQTAEALKQVRSR